MYTAHEIDRDGELARVYHRTTSGSSWTHPPGEVYRYWGERTSTQRETRGRYGWVEVPCDCPSVRTEGGQHRRPQAGEGVGRPADPKSPPSTSDGPAR